MSRYAQRSSNRDSQRAPPSAPQRRYSDDSASDSGEDVTAVATDISYAPPLRSVPSRASFNRDPVQSSRYFDEALPPVSVAAPPAYGRQSSSLAVPSYERQRKSSLDGRNQRPAPPPAPRQVRYESSDSERDASGSEEGSDKFTAVGTGVATEFDSDEEMETRGEIAVRGDSRQQQGRRYQGGYDDEMDAHVRQGRPGEGRDRYGRGGSGLESSNRDPPQQGRQTSRTTVQFDNPPPSRRYDDYGAALPPVDSRSRGLAPPRDAPRPSSAGGNRDTAPVESYTRAPVLTKPPPVAPSKPAIPDDTPEEKALIRLLKDMNFSTALKDFHDRFGVGVTKTIVVADGLGHAYVKIHCKKLPKHEWVVGIPHFQDHWIPLAGSRWEFRTVSHRVTIVWITLALAAYEHSTRYGR